MNSWGTVLLSFVNSLYSLIINFLSDIGNLGKLVDDNVLSKSWSSYWQHERHFSFGEQCKELGGTPRERGSKQPILTALESTGTLITESKEKTGQRGRKEELANKQDTNSLKSVFIFNSRRLSNKGFLSPHPHSFVSSPLQHWTWMWTLIGLAIITPGRNGFFTGESLKKFSKLWEISHTDEQGWN